MRMLLLGMGENQHHDVPAAQRAVRSAVQILERCRADGDGRRQVLHAPCR